MWGISLLAENGLASQEGLCSMEWVSKQITAGLKTREQKFCARSANCKLYNFQPDITRQLSSNELSNLSTQNSGAEALRLPAVATLMFLETKSKGNYMWEFGGGGAFKKTDRTTAGFNVAFTDLSYSIVSLFVGRGRGRRRGGRYDCPPLATFHRHPVLPATYTWVSMAISSFHQQQIIRHET